MQYWADKAEKQEHFRIQVENASLQNSEAFNKLDGTLKIIAAAIIKREDIFVAAREAQETQEARMESLHHQMKAYIRTQHESTQQVIIDEFQAGLRRRLTNINLDQFHREPTRAEVANWLSPLDFMQRQVEIYSQRAPQTGDWLLHSQEYKRWSGTIPSNPESDDEGTDEATSLWCTGIRKFTQGILRANRLTAN